jgi:predicted SprT family Zn-dependent metalloprotease
MLKYENKDEVLKLVNWTLKKTGLKWRDIAVNGRDPPDHLIYCNRSYKTIAKALILYRKKQFVDWDIHISNKVFFLFKLAVQKEIIIHEACHVIDAYLTKIRLHHHHGQTWQDLMVKCDYEPRATIDVFKDIKNDKHLQRYLKITKTYVKECPCGLRTLVNKSANKTYLYTCNTCGRDVRI